MAIYTVKKSMQSTFDFGYEATVDPTNKFVKAFVYDKDDHDCLVMSFIACESEDMNPVVYATGVVCRRSTCFGDEMIESFDEQQMGEHILREMAKVFETAYPKAELRLYSETDYHDTCRKTQQHALDVSCILAHTELPRNATIDIAKHLVPWWVSYKHDPEAIRNTLRIRFTEAFDDQ